MYKKKKKKKKMNHFSQSLTHSHTELGFGTIVKKKKKKKKEYFWFNMIDSCSYIIHTILFSNDKNLKTIQRTYHNKKVFVEFRSENKLS